MRKVLLAGVFVLALAARAAAGDTDLAPEIDGAAAVGAAGLLAVGLFMIRARSKRK